MEEFSNLHFFLFKNIAIKKNDILSGFKATKNAKVKTTFKKKLLFIISNIFSIY